jgi:hypothetical protein
VDLVALNQTRNQAVLDDFYLRTLHAAIDFREQRRRIMGV